MGNKIFTKAIEKRMEKYPLYSQDGKGEESTVILKVFNPYGSGTWLITEGEKQDNGDWLLYGYCHIHEWEWGYILLSELVNTRVRVFGCSLPLEREVRESDGKHRVRDLV